MAKTAVVISCYIVLVFIIGFEAVTAQDCTKPDADVLIFGAGTAGLTAARLLYDNGINNILVLEANNYCGGRVKQENFGGTKVEVGANWIHEARPNSDPNKLSSPSKLSNPIYELSKDSKCYSPRDFLKGRFTYAYGSSGENDINKLKVVDLNKNNPPVSSEKLKKTLMEYKSAIEPPNPSESLNPTESPYPTELPCPTESPSPTDKSVREGLTEEGWTWNMKNSDSDDRLKQLVEWSEFDFNYATTPECSSLELTATDDEFGDSCYLVTDTRDDHSYASILECIAKPFQDKIMTEAKVTKITRLSECVCATISTRQGEEKKCGKYGIVTFSIGVLQHWIESKEGSNNEIFSPALSVSKQEAIRKSRMGHYLKIFVHFNNVFWDEDKDYIYRTVANSNDRGYYQVIQPYSSDPPIILMTLVGDKAKEAFGKGEKRIKEDIKAVLREWYGNTVVPDSFDIHFKDWTCDQYFRGSFSNNPLGLTEDDKRVLSEPEGRLYFSGEGNSIKHGGTVHGAYCSGVETAIKIVKAKKGSATTITSSLLYDCEKGQITRTQSNTAEQVSPSSATTLSVSVLAMMSVLVILLAAF